MTPFDQFAACFAEHLLGKDWGEMTGDEQRRAKSAAWAALLKLSQVELPSETLSSGSKAAYDGMAFAKPGLDIARDVFRTMLEQLANASWGLPRKKETGPRGPVG